jgi:sodium-coupled neutral amino acid transporter 9
VPLFTSQVADSFGVFAVSFFIHSMLIPIIKNNRHYHHNQRDLTLGFCLTGGIYISIGAFGACAIAGR